jgi:two-component system sensor histidine kinase EvgS
VLSRTHRLNGRTVLGILVLVAGLATSLACAGEPQLHSRLKVSTARLAQLDLPDDDRRWLWRRRTLKVGVMRADAPPFNLLGNGQHYEGISAEYVNLLSEVLHLQVHIVPYGTCADAVAALGTGGIDVLATACNDAALSSVARSQPYATDQPVLVRRVDRAATTGRPARPALAVVGDYASAADAEALAPGYQAVPAPSLLTGLAAVALGQADAVIGTALMVAAQPAVRT